MSDVPQNPIPRSKSTREDALEVLRRLRNAGHIAFFAGGCVRDFLLGRDPKDYDVATDAPPKRVRELFSNTQAVGAAFGVILVRYHGSQIEVATFRTDVGYTDGRHPSKVRFTTPQEDARRRDFTINGLFLDPIADEVIDYVGGRDDLKAGVIRAIGNPAERFEEDSLRLLRAIRFSARFHFQIEPVTAAAIIAHAPQLKRISPERIAEELRIMLTATTRPAAWRMLWELELIETLFRFLKFPRRAEDQGPDPLFDRIAPDNSIPFGLALAAATVCHRMRTDANLSDVRELFTRSQVQAAVNALRQALKISNDESEQMRGTLGGLEPLLANALPGVAKLKRFLAEPTAPLSRELMAALAGIGVQTARITHLQPILAELEQTEYAPSPFIDGDLLTEKGLTPGPIFKRILEAAYDAQLEGRLHNREDAIEFAMQLSREKGRE
jgi:tRNA nucleotidyltransferase/poly(A) polymerase